MPSSSRLPFRGCHLTSKRTLHRGGVKLQVFRYSATWIFMPALSPSRRKAQDLPGLTHTKLDRGEVKMSGKTRRATLVFVLLFHHAQCGAAWQGKAPSRQTNKIWLTTIRASDINNFRGQQVKGNGYDGFQRESKRCYLRP